MTPKTRAISVAVAVGLTAIAAVGAYQLGHTDGFQQEKNKQFDQQASLGHGQPFSKAPPAAATPSTNLGAASPSMSPPAQVGGPPAALPSGSTMTTSSSTTYHGPQPLPPTSARMERPVFDSRGELTSVAPATSSEKTVVEREVTYRNYPYRDRSYRTYPMYRTGVVVRYHHHSAGKIHVARATKHTVGFVAKLPGRLRL